jgi:ElaB/YqjD/DUF883 family membrane-anchored ribosome-binding protein
MDRTTTTTGNLAGGSHLADPLTSKVEDAARSAHRVTDQVADKATAAVDQLSGTTHRAINSAADATTSAAAWGSSVAEQAKQTQTRLTESASRSIRARPLSTVAGVLAIGYLLGRLARL